MNEAIENASGELKRADHLLYVSLKYTRTVDMLKHVVSRLITAIDFSLEALLLLAKSQKKIDELPPSPGLRIEATKNLFANDDKILDYVTFFIFLRKLDRQESFTRAREFRRHVTMTTVVDGEEQILNIDIVHEYYDKTKEIFAYVKEWIDEGRKV